MKIDGKVIAASIKQRLIKQVKALRIKNIIPHLAIVLVGSDPGSLIYINQKQKVGDELQVKISNFQSGAPRAISNFKKQELRDLLNRLNNDPSIHGIIIQRPVPLNIPKRELDKLVAPQKDVDGFHSDSPFTPPVVLAVVKILEWLHQDINKNSCNNYRATVYGSYAINYQIFFDWLTKQKILVIGRGETAGRPIAQTFEKIGIKYSIAHSKTTNLKELCLSSNIIISCVGRPNIVRLKMITKNTILIGVGLHTEQGKLQPDYNQVRIAEKAAYYTPVPGGIGPVNVACLFENLVKAVRTTQ